jgi:hypothetical protein
MKAQKCLFLPKIDIWMYAFLYRTLKILLKKPHSVSTHLLVLYGIWFLAKILFGFRAHETFLHSSNAW